MTNYREFQKGDGLTSVSHSCSIVWQQQQQMKSQIDGRMNAKKRKKVATVNLANMYYSVSSSQPCFTKQNSSS